MSQRRVSLGFKVCPRQPASVHSIMRVRRTVVHIQSHRMGRRECILLCVWWQIVSRFFILGPSAERKGWRKRWRKRRLQMRWLWRAPRTREPRERKRERERRTAGCIFPWRFGGAPLSTQLLALFSPSLTPWGIPSAFWLVRLPKVRRPLPPNYLILCAVCHVNSSTHIHILAS